MKLELIGLISGTIAHKKVEEVVEYGLTNQVLSELVIFLHDGERKIHGEIRVVIDWREHEVQIARSFPAKDAFQLPQSGKLSAPALQRLMTLFNEYAKSHGLSYWYNVLWTADSNQHDVACGITRMGPFDQPYESLELETVEVLHPSLPELGITAALHIKNE
jgi:hypothetical protein